MPNPEYKLQKIDKLSDCKEALGHVPTRKSRRIDRRRHRSYGASSYTYRTGADKNISELLEFYSRWTSSMFR